MKWIVLSNQIKVCVDDDDFEWLSNYKWYYSKGYASRITYFEDGTIKTNTMHREIMGNPKGGIIDHINRNSLDNRKENLRIVTTKQNSMNARKTRSECSSYYKGVRKHKHLWLASVHVNNKYYGAGYHKSQVLAAIAYDEKAIELFGEYAGTNFSEKERQDLKNKRLEDMK